MPNAPLDRPLFTQAFIISASVTCGFGMWLVTQLREKKEINLDIKVEAVSVPTEVRLTLHPEQIRAKFSYPSIEEAKMRADNFYAEVDFSDLKQRIGRRLEEKGDRTISREQIHDKVDAGRYNITTVDLITPQISWEASLRHTRARIQPLVTGKPAEGFIYTSESASDERGPEIIVLLSEKKELELSRDNAPLTITTKPIDVTGKSGMVRESAELDLPAGVSLLPEEEDQKTRTIYIDIGEQEISRTLENVPVTYQFISAAQGLRAEITPATVNVTVKGRTSLVNKLTPSMISFGLFGVVERPGETREVAIDPLITDPVLRQENLQVESDPTTVVVKVTEDKKDAPPATTPAATPSPTASPAPPDATTAPGG